MSRQSDVQIGPLVRVAGANLTDKEGYLAVYQADGEVELCGANARPLFVIDDGATTGERVTLLPIEPGRNYRVCATEAITVGTEIETDANGKVGPLDAGTARGVCEEAATGADTFALIRFY